MYKVQKHTSRLSKQINVCCFRHNSLWISPHLENIPDDIFRPLIKRENFHDQFYTEIVQNDIGQFFIQLYTFSRMPINSLLNILFSITHLHTIYTHLFDGDTHTRIKL